ncbi:hypothetical protein AOLI_G00042730 [Acnodon oligacanthus]
MLPGSSRVGRSLFVAFVIKSVPCCRYVRRKGRCFGHSVEDPADGETIQTVPTGACLSACLSACFPGRSSRPALAALSLRLRRRLRSPRTPRDGSTAARRRGELSSHYEAEEASRLRRCFMKNQNLST